MKLSSKILLKGQCHCTDFAAGADPWDEWRDRQAFELKKNVTMINTYLSNFTHKKFLFKGTVSWDFYVFFVSMTYKTR